jgi:small nuclear ribonucleoprotein (snRNP)-like protein
MPIILRHHIGETVIVNLVDGSAIQGILTSVRRTDLILEHPEALRDRHIDQIQGWVVIAMSQVSWIQLVDAE